MPLDGPTLYRKLLNLYPHRFKERFGESMEQTFNDLYNERKQQAERGIHFFIFWMFIETGMGIINERVLFMMKGESIMKHILSHPRSAAITSSILSLPLGLLFVIFNFDIEPLTIPITSLLTVNGSDVNVLGRIVLIGGLFLLPVAFVINILPMLKREGLEQKRQLYAINLIVAAIILCLITLSWGGLIVEQL